VRRRILLLVTDLRIGGTPTVVRELALRLTKEEDVAVHVACLDRWGPVADQLREKGVAVTALEACGRFDARVIFKLLRLLKRQQIDTVFSFLVHANAVAAICSLLARHDRFIQSIQTTQPYPRWHWKVQRILQSAAQMIVVPSASAAAVARDWAGVPQEKIVVIPNAVDPREFSVRSPTAGRRVGFIGRLDPIKRIPDLVKAISFLPQDVRLDIFGEGSDHGEISAEISSLNLRQRVALRGEVQTPIEALAEFDLLVLPSDAEGFGLVLIEAMAAGVPVIGTNVPGIRDVIVDGVNGLLSPPRNPRALADAIERIFFDAPLREKLIAGGKQSVWERFDWDVVYGQYRSLLLNRT
jgi:glycosyltransferase involved in cell wall biosynthesis